MNVSSQLSDEGILFPFPETKQATLVMPFLQCLLVTLDNRMREIAEQLGIPLIEV